MSFEEFMSIFYFKKKEKPIWFELEMDRQATEQELIEIEELLNITLPIEYKQFVSTFGGGYFAFTEIYSTDSESDWYIIKQNNLLELLRTNGVVVFSSNGAGDYYGFKESNRKCENKIVFYNHETREIQETPYKNLFDFVVDVGFKQLNKKDSESS